MAATIDFTGNSSNARVCAAVRTALCAAGPRPAQSLTHLASCPRCAAFARRLDLAREALATPLSPPWAVRPDANFAARVRARIEQPSELLGWAAFRALPAAVGLALALAVLGISWSPAAPAPAPSATAVTAQASSTPPLLEEPSADQLVAWASAPVEATP